MGNIQVLSMQNICKSFPGVKALEDVSLELDRGDVLALIGENGAGKSTLIKILSGAYKADKGKIFFEGKPITITDPRDSINLGVSVIYQELNNSDPLTIAENIFMGDLPLTKAGHLVDYKKLKTDSLALLQRVGLYKYSPSTLVSELSIAEKQMVEIAKALSKKVKILVLDEPTAALNNEEIDILFRLIKQLAGEGIAIIYISHRLDEIFEISNKVQVLRDGSSIAMFNTHQTNKHELITMMVGREITDMYPARNTSGISEKLFDVEHLQSDYIQDISFSVKQGEILGLFGLMGSGRREIVEMIFGARKRKSGVFKVDGKTVEINSPQNAKKYGIGYVPSDRKAEGLFLIHSVGTNITINILKFFLTKFHTLDFRKEKIIWRHWIDQLRIKTPSSTTQIDSLSGGNQQKVVVAKWLAAKPRLLILNEPTRGIDVGAKNELYNLINELSSQGIAFIMVSSELPEIMAMSDRILVVHEGRFKGELERSEFSQERLLTTAIGD